MFNINYLVNNQISGWNGSDNPFGTAGYLQLVQGGVDTLFQVDLNGGGDNFVTLVEFQNTNATSFTDANFIPNYPPDGTVPAGITLVGTASGERLDGTIGADTLSGEGGNDQLYGGGSGDVLNGGEGRDYLYGEGGDDTLNGGEGDDVLNGGDGADTMDGGNGNDTFYGDNEYNTPGFDTMIGGDGDDRFYTVGYYASDIVDAGAGNDTVQIYLQGNSLDISNPEITLGTGTDTLELSYTSANAYAYAIVTDFDVSEDRVLINSFVNNNLVGWDGASNPFGAGYMRLVQNGTETLLQGDTNGGGDNYITIAKFQNTTASTFSDANFVINEASVQGYSPDGSGVNGQVTVGSAADETLNGTFGDDTINGAGGADIINGANGNDTLEGGAGTDTLTGGFGADTFIFNFGDGNDTVADFGTGEDILDLVGTGFTDFADVLAAAADVGSNVEIAIGADTVTLENITKAELAADDFNFL